MQTSPTWRIGRLLGFVAISTLGAPLSLAVAADAASAQAQTGANQESQAAVWTPKESSFTYLGFTAHYSCDGLRDKIYRALLQLGANKKDLHVSESGCTAAAGRPEPFPGVRIRMSVLEPADAARSDQPATTSRSDKSAKASRANQPADAAGSDQAPVSAHWQPVSVRIEDFDHGSDAGYCELMEQIHTKIVPLFATRNVEFKTDCVPFQAGVPSTVLKLEVLKPDAPTDKPAG